MDEIYQHESNNWADVEREKREEEERFEDDEDILVPELD